jgi:hypothetical protein
MSAGPGDVFKDAMATNRLSSSTSVCNLDAPSADFLESLRIKRRMRAGDIDED